MIWNVNLEHKLEFNLEYYLELINFIVLLIALKMRLVILLKKWLTELQAAGF